MSERKKMRQPSFIREESAPYAVMPRTKNGHRANELDGKTWTKYSISIWSDIKKSREETELNHPAIFPLMLAQRLIECFTDKNDLLVLDPFAGIGTTMVAADRMNKTGIGIEISSKFVEVAQHRLGQRELFSSKPRQSEVFCDDSINLLKSASPESVDMVITSPPYWDILTQKRTADYKPIRHYGEAERDLGKIANYEEFLGALVEIFRRVHTAMKPNKYCVVVVMDIRKKDKFYSFHSDLARALTDKVGFVFDDLIIWDRRAEYNNMRPLGYPSVCRINKAHEYILIFKKAKVG